jgi:hypothetical protein
LVKVFFRRRLSAGENSSEERRAGSFFNWRREEPAFSAERERHLDVGFWRFDFGGRRKVWEIGI